MRDLISSINAVAGPSERSAREDAGDEPSLGGRPSAEPTSAPSVQPSTLSGVSAFAAQVIGQAGRRRGLKAGAPMLEEAKSAYLETEFSGAGERRARKGRMTRTDV